MARVVLVAGVSCLVLALEVSEIDRIDRGVVRPMLLKGW